MSRVIEQFVGGRGVNFFRAAKNTQTAVIQSACCVCEIVRIRFPETYLFLESM